MIAIAVAIVFMYIQPKISSIRETQDLTSSYEVETQNVSQINESLKAKIAVIEAITPQDTQALTRYVPDTIDEIAVLKDLSIVLESQSINSFNISYQGNNAGTQQEDYVSEYGPVTEHYFSASFDSTYSQLKSLLGLLETNNYLLQVTNLKITDSEDDLITVDMSLTAFTRLLATPELN
jgi:hypothetical protein